MTRPRVRRSLYEAAHKLDEDIYEGSAPPTPKAERRRSLNESAHKLGHWPVVAAPTPETAKPSAALQAADSDQLDVVANAGSAVLALGALGIVYGDIGTSPLYTEQVIFTAHRAAARTTVAGVYGVASLIFWALMIVVSMKYAGFIMRAHNRGDGGIMALTALIRRRKVARAAVLVTLGVFGAGLFFGDGIITPAISVISAVEGLNVAVPSLAHLVVPISLGILLGLFALQRFGTRAAGWLFGPIILIWFLAMGIFGGREVLAHPGVLQALSPIWAVRFMTDHGVAAFLALGGVVLAVTGAEALYADRGHFGAGPIRVTWFAIVLPAVMLSYLGQAALILARPSSVSNPFFLLVPNGARIPIVLLATAATVIASQAVITGAFSVAKQAMQLGLLPRLKIVHTSNLEGQIYVPLINWALCIGVVALVLVFQHSAKLADIYGVAVTGTFILNTTLFLAVARSLWHAPRWKLAGLGALFLTVEVAFFSSNLAKITHGGWLPLGVGLAISVVMINWHKGREIVTKNRAAQEQPLEEFLDSLRTRVPRIQRVPGAAVFLNPSKQTVPLALRAEVDFSHSLHDKVVIVSLETVSLPRVTIPDRFVVQWLGHGRFKVVHVTVRVGYRERQDVPAALALARKRGLVERNLDLEHASYFLSHSTIVQTGAPGMRPWRKRLFITMARNAASPIDHFGLPRERVVIIGSQDPI